MAIIGLDIERLTSSLLDSDIREAEELNKIVNQLSNRSSAEQEVARAVSAKLRNTESRISHTRNILRGDKETLDRVAYSWRVSDFIVETVDTGEVRDDSFETATRALRPGRPGPGSLLITDQGEIASSFLEPRGEELATIRLIDQAGNPVKLLNGAEVLTDFLLQQVSELRQEKYQIQESFGRAFLYAFGSRQEVYSLSGVLVDFKNMSWRQNFIKLYQQQMRASVAIKNGHFVRIAYRGSVREGQLLNLNISLSESRLNHVIFSLTMFIEDQYETGGKPTVSTSVVQQIPGLTKAKVKNEVLIRAPGVPFTIVEAIRSIVLDENNKVRSGQETGVWRHPEIEK